MYYMSLTVRHRVSAASCKRCLDATHKRVAPSVRVRREETALDCTSVRDLPQPRLLLNYLPCLMLGHTLDTAHPVLRVNSVEAISRLHHLWTKCCEYHLGAPSVAHNEVCKSRTVLCIQRRVDLIEEVEGCGLQTLDGED